MALGQTVQYGDAVSFGEQGTFECRIKRILRTTSTFDQASIAASGSAEATVTVTGAALGDLAFAAPQIGSPDASGTDNMWLAYVSAADTVKIRFINNGAAADDMASQTWTVIVVDIT